ncbi:hypothetical protein UY3_16216 [Chelonia mydas]|uniref:Uncharacterized protein n=1 Tax=Chelonia mydas TaxID=8469 RepID=M7ANA4_CHEMY|nr:hypothetical protein UY3_16216 [Chelonia mydas]
MCWLPLPAAPIGLEQRTVASESYDRPNLQTPQGKPLVVRASLFTCCVRKFGRSRLPVAAVHRSSPMRAAGSGV